MNTTEQNVASHYTQGQLETTIINALRSSGHSLEKLSIDDLASVTEYHIRGRKSTEELLEWIDLNAGSRVLDVGCGIGGASRIIASKYGCPVVGLDLSAEYCRVARSLSGFVGLEEQTTYRQGSALDMPFEDGSFDVALSQHVQMNVADKNAYFREIRRVLRPGGRLALYEICGGSTSPVYHPVPWAPDKTISFLVSPRELRRTIEGLQFTPIRWEDVTDRGRAWFEQILAKVKEEGPPPVGLHLLMGADAPEKMQNVVRNLQEERIALVQAVFQKEATS